MAKTSAERERRTSIVPWWTWLLALPLVALFGLRAFFTTYKNPSGSMSPTLLVGDHVIARSASPPPARGDVVVFEFPENRSQLFVKRVMALPGDTLEAIGGRPILNGWLVPNCYVGEYKDEGRSSELYIEYLGERAYGTLFDTRPREATGCTSNEQCEPGEACRSGVCGILQGPFKAAAGEVWVLGDNRNNSHDSRNWRGGLGAGLPFDHLKGRATTIWISFKSGGGVDGDRNFIPVDGPPVLPAPLAVGLKSPLEKCLANRPAKTSPG